MIALSQLQVEEAVNAIADVLAGDRIELVVKALVVISHRDDARWCPAVRRLFERLDPNAGLRRAQAWRLCAKILLRHGVGSEDVLNSLAKANRYEIAEAALLALRYDPPRAPALFRRALRSKNSYERTNAAAMLGVLDEDWSRRLMLDVLRDSHGIFATAECRSALAFSGVPEVRRAAADWERRHESVPELETRDLMVYLGRTSMDGLMQSTMEDFHDTVLPLRGRLGNRLRDFGPPGA